ncbi:MAG TPA: polymer-forming cytoskeletal protein [Anaerolineae bacterium]|nr:polymer-forming cytoskeletal protein [Anaerolineae bacterium]
MFRRKNEFTAAAEKFTERVDSVLGPGITWQGQVSGTGGVRIEAAFDGEIALRGLVVIGERGRVTCEHIRGVTVIVAGSVKGDITANKVEITRTGRVWGDVVTKSFSTQEGAFLRGKITMEEELDLGLGPVPELDEEGAIEDTAEEGESSQGES